MGKGSVITIFLICFNLMGFLAIQAYGLEGSWLQEDTPLAKLYTREFNTTTNETLFSLDNSSLTGSVPGSIDEGIISRVFDSFSVVALIFDFVLVIIGILAAPLALFAIAGFPYEIIMMLGIPLGTLYIYAIVDLFTGGDS